MAAPPAATLAAQESVAPASCAPLDTTAAWHVGQRMALDDSKRAWSDDAFRSALVRAAGLDLARPLPVQLGYEIVDQPPGAAVSSDTAVLARLRALARQRGARWPTRSVVGAAGVRAVWVLARVDTALAPSILRRMMEAGPDESLPADLAVLEDRQRVRSGRKQLHATQLRRTPDGTLEPLPTEEPERVDERREGVGLPPLAVSLCAAAAPAKH
jgi:hypothetical protein